MWGAVPLWLLAWKQYSMRNKLKRFEENKHRPNVIEPGKPVYTSVKGNWRQQFFRNNGDIVLELACGWGEYTVGLARVFPEQNFIGVDVKGDRLWKGSGLALEEGLSNAAFLRTNILQLTDFFERDEVNEIWITFPDPRPRKRDVKRRLMHPRYLDLYKEVLISGGKVRLKTDNDLLFAYSLEVLEFRQDISGLLFTWDLRQSHLLMEHHGIQTKYERKFSKTGKKIKYLRFELNDPN